MNNNKITFLKLCILYRQYKKIVYSLKQMKKYIKKYIIGQINN